MKHSIQFISTLLVFGLPVIAQAACDTYPNSEHRLSLPATITVPDSLPVGGIITSQAFSGTAPGLNILCRTPTQRTIIGRYRLPQHSTTGAFSTEASGVGLVIRIRDARGITNGYALYNQNALFPAGTWPTFTNAEAIFYKIGPVTDGVVPAGSFFDDRWAVNQGRFHLLLNNPVRFVRPAATCDLAAGDVNRTIGLPTIRASALRDVSSAGASNFELTANCSNASSVTFRFTGTPASGDAARFANTGSARGVGLWLYSRVGGSNQTISNGNTRVVTVSGNRAVLPLGAAYWKNGTVTQGSLSSTTTVAITYN